MCQLIPIYNKEQKEIFLRNWDIIKKEIDSNPHGIGIAYIWENTVFWNKGITEQDLRAFFYEDWEVGAVHFRLASVGKVTPELCHPFPITTDLKKLNKLCGFSKAVLFHNGHITKLTEKIIAELKPKLKEKLKNYHWSDTKVLAWLLGYYGIDFIKFISSIETDKFVILTPDGIQRYGYFYKHKGLLFSSCPFSKYIVYRKTHGYSYSYYHPLYAGIQELNELKEEEENVYKNQKD